MRFLKTTVISACIALTGVILLPSVHADDWDRKTTVKFSQPVEIPGVHLEGWGVLPAGTYVFKILDSASDRHIVQIFDEKETTVYATILAIPNYRLKTTDKTVITFSERPAGQPEALRAWFYPGRQWGEEFVYSKEKALELAKTTNQPVLFTPVEITPEVSAPIKSATEQPVIALRQAPVRAVRPSGEEVEIAQVVTPLPPAEIEQSRVPEAAPALMAENRPATLPNTAGSLPLMALLGLLALGGVVILGFVQKTLVR